MEASEVDNDTRGWIMCAVSGAACVAGASVIFVDILVRQFPGKRGFRIQDSNVFLASSLSLSFGVMLFSALYSMLPSSKPYLVEAGYSESTASLIVMTAFVGGFCGIQVISRVLHQFMPSHVVDCDHSHDQAALEEQRDCGDSVRGTSRSRSGARGENGKGSVYTNGHEHHHDHDHGHSHGHNHDHHHNNHHDNHHDNHHSHGHNDHSHQPRRYNHHLDDPQDMPDIPDENTPLVAHPDTKPRFVRPARTWTGTGPPSADPRPSVFQVPQRVLSFVKDTKSNCDEINSCYGYTDPCAQECFKHLGARPNSSLSVLHTTTGPVCDDVEGHVMDARTSRARSRDALPAVVKPDAHHDASPSSASGHETLVVPENSTAYLHRTTSCHSHRSHRSHRSSAEQQHHHHVPTNAFMAIGLQTSIAITLHKFPEGFITYATNHANPDLGFSVFMALFVHNISEGFALALPLYMALKSRARAMAWASVLGGLSQPLGATIAALWFKLAAGRSVSPGAVFYAVLFAVTAGIMVSVALQLFVESMSLCHNRNLCIFFGFLGMALLGFSGALVGEHHH
jgi:ZIP family zinc transporter